MDTKAEMNKPWIQYYRYYIKPFCSSFLLKEKHNQSFLLGNPAFELFATALLSLKFTNLVLTNSTFLRDIAKYRIYMSHDTTKRVFGSFRPGQTQTGLRSHRS